MVFFACRQYIFPNFVHKYDGLVTNDTIHLSKNPPSFGTRGSLILDVSIAS